MRLKVQTELGSDELISSVSWSKTEKSYELFSCGDDKRVTRWNSEGQNQGNLLENLHSYPTSLHASKEIMVISFSDGSLLFATKAGREEKRIPNAHRGGIISVRWNWEKSAVATSGEDGLCKIWSRSGMLRTTLASMPHPIYSVAWGVDNESLILSCNKDIHFKSVQSGAGKQSQFRAHDGIVLMVDWSAVNNLILSCGEDSKYRVWDSYGRLLFSSAPHEHVITSISWSPNGKVFAVGAFNLLKLCDRSGWSYARETPDSGSIYSISWCEDGTAFAGAGGNGTLVFASLVDRTVSWQSLDISLDASLNTLIVRDLIHETIEEIDFRDRVTDFSVEYSQLVAVTNYQVFIYPITKGLLNTTPQVEDLKEPPTLILQCPEKFALVDNNGVRIYTYDGRVLSTIKYSGLRVEFLNQKTISLSNDMLAVIGQNAQANQSSQIRLFDVHSGKQLQVIDHKQEILHVALNQQSQTRKLAFLDKQKDLYLCPTHKIDVQKLSSMVEDFSWSDQSDVIVSLSDQKLLSFLYPNVLYVDATLLPLTIVSKPCLDAGLYAQIVSFNGAHVTIRKADGSLLAMMLSPYPFLLYQHVERGAWDIAIRLCRYIKMRELWGCLACMAVNSREMNSVEISLAAIEEIDKISYITHINSLPDEILKTAELALFCRRPDEALGILLANKRIFRAIKMCIRLHRWDQALELAIQNKTHVDTVLCYRDRHLKQLQHVENSEKFKQYSQEVPYDWDTVQSKIAMEKEKERGAG